MPEPLEDLAAIRERLDTTEEIIPLPFKGHKIFDNPDWFSWARPYFKEDPELQKQLWIVAAEVFSGRFDKYWYQDPAPPEATLRA